MAKITLATLKSFIKKNAGKVFIDVGSKFDSMTDCCQICDDGFVKATDTNLHLEHTLGIQGAWVVRGSRDYLYAYEDDHYVGIKVSNACGSFVVAIAK